MTSLRIRRLRLLGVARDYEVSFLDNRSSVRPLSIIAGEISTGKTSVLEFISYCLGGPPFPQHPEIRGSVRSALLECELAGDVFSIERAAVDRPSASAVVHSASLDELDQPHAQSEHVLIPPSSPDSLSQFLLRKLGLSEVILKEAPTKSVSGVDHLSIRDLMRLVFVEHSDLDNKNLLLENSPHVVRLKHEQVIDLVFRAHDNTAASMAAEAKAVEEALAKHEADLRSIDAFLEEQDVPPEDIAEARMRDLEEMKASVSGRLGEIERKMAAAAQYGNEQRLAHLEAANAARSLANEQRELGTQLERLTALAAQYDQDVKKLTFASEARMLFDPLGVSVCPWCLQPVDPTGEPVDDMCLVCHQPLQTDDEADDVDIDRELRSIKSRKRELGTLLNETNSRIAGIRRSLADAREREVTTQAALDAAVSARFSPFIAERDTLHEERAAISQEARSLQNVLRMRASAGRRRAELGNLRQRRQELLDAEREALADRRSRRDAVGELGQRFGEILRDFEFPKLSDPFLDERYLPHVRGNVYSGIGSSGALTLISLAWYLAVFERSAEIHGAHPGFLMIDSPQKNLLPRRGFEPDEFQSPDIAQAVYKHLVDWADSELGRTTQMIVVDNAPQPIGREHVVVNYSASAERPPYGLIEDAVE